MYKICGSNHFPLFKDIEGRLGKIDGLGMWDIAAFDNGTISGSGYDYNISFTNEEGFLKNNSIFMAIFVFEIQILKF